MSAKACPNTPTEPTKGSSTATVDTATGGGNSGSSAEQSGSLAGTRESASPAEANAAAWRLDAAPALGRRVVRSAVLGDLHVVLSVGDQEDGGPTVFSIPDDVVLSLETGRAPS